MKTTPLTLILAFIVLNCFSQPSVKQDFKPYLGQKFPGIKAVKFAEGIVSIPGTMDYCLTFSPDGKEIYWNRGNVGVMTTRWLGSEWSNPEPASFMNDYQVGEVHISPDGSFMLVNRRRGLAPGEEPGIWKMIRHDGKWTDPQFVISNGMRATSTCDASIYTTDISGFLSGSEDQGIIKKYVPLEGGYLADTIDIGRINSPEVDAHPLIAPDESWIIFNSRRMGVIGESDLFISRRDEHGTWSSPVNLTALNSEWADWCASLSYDAKYLFFTCNSDQDVYWVDVRILNQY